MDSLYEIVPTYIDNKVRLKNNKSKSWDYGYDEKWDLIVISKDGTLGDVYYINGIYIGLPEKPEEIDSRHNKWKPDEYPEVLSRIKTNFEFERRDAAFIDRWTPYIDQEFDRRERGYWFMNNGIPAYITGSHYMYLQWSKIDVGLPEFREANRIFWIFWEACVADYRSFGMNYVKIRRSGFSFMSAAETSHVGTMAKDAKLGILSKTGDDAKTLFTDKVVPIVYRYPFFFKPIQDGTDKPKSELSFRVPATKLTKRKMAMDVEDDGVTGLDTTIDWKATEDNSYDGEKLLRLVSDEASKWVAPKNILNNWKVVKTCLRLGSRVIGKCMMGSTVNAMAKGGENFKKLYEASDPRRRNKNGQTESGLYALFIPMEWNYEGYIDEYGFPVIEDPAKPVMGIDGKLIKEGAVTYWKNECDALKHDPDALNEHYRQFPRTLSHAFRDASDESLFNLTKINDQIDYNDTLKRDGVVVAGNFSWFNGERFSRVVWTPDPKGKFTVSWIPPIELQNNVIKKGDKFFPGNENIGAFGCDSYDISGTVDGGGSKGALSGQTAFSMNEKVPGNFFFLEYACRPPSSEIFFEDVLMACWFYGMPMLPENIKARILYHFKNAGCRAFVLNRPDKRKDALSKSELELGGIPGTGEDIMQAHAGGIETYVNKSVGYDVEGTYRDPDIMGEMYLTKTLQDWARFDIRKRTKYDLTIASGYAIMANNRHLFHVRKEIQPATIKIARYDNSGAISRIVK
jgi:hypothetical protein